MKVGLGILLIAMGTALEALSHMFGGTRYQEFLVGVLQGVALAVVLLGVYAILRGAVGGFVNWKKRHLH